MAFDRADQELMETLRVQYTAQFEENWKKKAALGFIDDDARQKLSGIDAEMTRLRDELVAQQSGLVAQQKRVDNAIEHISRPPGGGLDAGAMVKTIGRKFVESDPFTKANLNGKFSIQATLTKTRIVDIGRKAAGANIVEGGPTAITPPVGAYPIFPRRVGIIPQQYPPPLMRDLLDVVPLDATNAIEYVTEAWSNNADYQVAQGDKKAFSGVTYTDHTAVVRTIAHYVKVSRQMAADVSFIITTIENRLVLFVLLKEDNEILYGDNSAGHLYGIMPQATAATVYYVGPAPATDTGIDQLRAAATYIEAQFLFPSAYVLHPALWARVQGLKTSLGTYLLPGVPAEDATPRLWGLPVVTTPNMVVTDYLCGAFPGNAALFDRETVNVEMAFQNEDDFVRNLITLRAEERVALAVYVPKAFAKGPFITTTPAALAALAADDNGGTRAKK